MMSINTRITIQRKTVMGKIADYERLIENPTDSDILWTFKQRIDHERYNATYKHALLEIANRQNKVNGPAGKNNIIIASGFVPFRLAERMHQFFDICMDSSIGKALLVELYNELRIADKDKKDDKK